MAHISTVIQKTGFVYNPGSESHFCNWDPAHVEGPHRTKAIMARLEDPKDNLVKQCQRLPGRSAGFAELKLVHTPELVKDVNHTCSDPGTNDENLKAFSERYNDVYVNTASEECAYDAAGSTISLVAHVFMDKVKNGLAVVRPPGHHASPAESNGFCIFNNVAVAAKYLMDMKNAERILIVDWDVHHGQGTQRTFYDDKRVLYFSIHRYEQGDFWPNLPESNFNYIGEGSGKGYNINVPLNKTGLGDADYLAILYQVLLPVAYEFNPEMVIVSAGYDAAIGCPEGRMNVSPAFYGHFTHALMNLAGGKIAVILEGGYCADSLSEGVACTLEVLLGRPPIPLPALGRPDQSVVDSILNVISVLRDHWKGLVFQDRFDVGVPPSKGMKVHKPEVVFNGPTEPCANEAYCASVLYSASERVDIRHRLAALKSSYDVFRKSKSSLRTCYGYDIGMLDHASGPLVTDVWDTPQRLEWIYDHLKHCGILHACHAVDVLPAGKGKMALFHDSTYAEVLETASDEAFIQTVKFHTDPATDISLRWAADLFASKGSADAIRLAVGCLQSVVDEVLGGKSLNGFAIVRPPGHHAHSNHPAGFCFANNVGIAAKTLIEQRGLKRVLIVDYDVHHGDGVQEAFYDDPRVLYISIHRGLNGTKSKENGGDFYPLGPGKGAKNVGTRAGVGFNINLPWTEKEKTDGDYISAFLQLVMPVAYEFAPEMTLVCCGFDAAAGDKGQMSVSPAGFYLMTRMLKSLAGGRLVLALEGGYKQEVLEQSSEAVMRALMDLPLVKQESLHPSEKAVRDIKSALDIQTTYWTCLQYRVILSTPGGTLGEPSSSSAEPVPGTGKRARRRRKPAKRGKYSKSK
ncbi:Histone deacetylase 6 [Hypsibius exemplaris]|uniref:Histone deacetylase 6 n=1 Tax=Hypsibius exemplaris TaxID=2072580 RepID=A0A1W0XDI2_HYPEX|nr:Histone deacetylase 6 [Hypsibius exemplaris]